MSGMFRHAIIAFWTSLLDLVFPPRCGACGSRVTVATRFCAPCESTVISGLEPACTTCGVVFLDPPAVEEPTCLTCARDPPPFTRARGAFAYGAAVQDAIARWKNRPDESVGKSLAVRFVDAIASEVRPTVASSIVVSIPSAVRALRRRGFNPPAILARALARRARLRYLPTALEIARAPRTSRGLGRSGRSTRMRGVFRARATRVAGARVILVDDVMTTGATLRAAARACLAAGAESVECFVLARVPA